MDSGRVSNLAKWFMAVHLAIVLTVTAGYATAKPEPRPPFSEIRALWVDEFHAGIRTPAEADELVAAAQRCNANTLFVQVRGRGDALYLQSFEPPREDPAYDPHFDALEYILTAAHRAGLEVHAWINAMPVWRDPAPPIDPRHVFLQHGVGQSGDADWLTHSPQGETKFPVGYFLDPGHPAAAAYLAEVYLNIVRHYAVDGIHFDYIRYPETDTKLPRGAPVGYNPTNLARFRRFTGRTDSSSLPEPGDQQWTGWRRQQVTQLVRRVYIEAKAINPKLKISAAVIAWGRPPLSKKDFSETAPMQRIFQDWRGWLEEGILDLAVPMNYARERDPVVRSWFDGWIEFEAQNKSGRQLAVGLGAYLNPREATLAQIERARHAGKKNHPDGVSVFSYFVPYAAAVSPAAAGTQGPTSPPAVATPAATSESQGATPQTAAPQAAAPQVLTSPPAAASPQAASPAEDASTRLSFLAIGVAGDASSREGAFREPASIPKMRWIEHPDKGWLAGFARQAGVPVDGAVVELKRAGWFGKTQRTLADGNGFFGFANLRPGKYHAGIKTSSGRQPRVDVEITSGSVARIELPQQ